MARRKTKSISVKPDRAMSKPLRKAKLIHFTHHPCMLERERLREPRELRARSEQYKNYRSIYGSGARCPHWVGCSVQAKRPLLTLDREQVTCGTCLSMLDSESLEACQLAAKDNEYVWDQQYHDERVKKWVDDQELIARAWIVCCRRYDVPAPMPMHEIMMRERFHRARIVQALSGVSLLRFIGPIPADDTYTTSLECQLATLAPSDRMLCAPVLEYARRADRLLAEAQQEIAAMHAFVSQTASRIRSAALVSLPEAGGKRFELL